jgi:septum formation protein
MLSHLDQYEIVLASQSPRRRELLAGLNIKFEALSIDADESFPGELKAKEIPLYLAEKKSDAYKHIMNEYTLLITADTIVWHEDKVYNKPTSREEAFRMLQTLSGNTHEVITGVCIRTVTKKKTFHVTSQVRFTTLTNQEIEYYLDHYQPYDKAGAYGVQEWIGYVAVEHINGSYFNVMGLPIQQLYSELKQW